MKLPSRPGAEPGHRTDAARRRPSAFPTRHARLRGQPRLTFSSAGQAPSRGYPREGAGMTRRFGRTTADVRHPPGRTAQNPHPVQTATAEGAERRATVVLRVSFAGRPALHARRLVHRLRKPRSGRGRPVAPRGAGPFADSGPRRLRGSVLAQNPSRALRRSTARPRPSAGRAACNPRPEASSPPRPAADVPGPRAPVLAGAGAAPPPHGRPVRTRLPAGEGQSEESMREARCQGIKA